MADPAVQRALRAGKACDRAAVWSSAIDRFRNGEVNGVLRAEPGGDGLPRFVVDLVDALRVE
jgi:hypothetical protein